MRTTVSKQIVFSLAAALLMLASPAHAAPQSGGEAKQPAAPLFPRHHRGLYKDAQGLEVIDATPQSPPLVIDDPGVPEKGQYEINLTFNDELSRNGQRFDLLRVDANYGMLPTIAGHELPIQLKLEFPVAATRDNASSFTMGVGAAVLGVKVNVYTNEHRGVSVSVYPQLEFVAPATGSVEKGLAENGETVIIPLLVSKNFKHLTLVVNGAVEQPLHDSGRRAVSELGVGAGRAITRKLAAMVEVHGESAFNFNQDRLVLVSAGLIHGISHAIVYARLGRSLFSDDGQTRFSVLVGMKILTQTGH